MDEQDEDALFDQLAKNLQAVRQDAELVRSRGFEGISAGVARAEAALETVTAENEALRQRLEQQQAVTERLEAAAVKSEADLERLRQTVNELSRRVRAQAELLGRSSGGGLRRGAWVGLGVIVVAAGCAAAWIASDHVPGLDAMAHRAVLRFSELSGMHLTAPSTPAQAVRPDDAPTAENAAQVPPQQHAATAVATAASVPVRSPAAGGALGTAPANTPNTPASALPPGAGGSVVAWSPATGTPATAPSGLGDAAANAVRSSSAGTPGSAVPTAATAPAAASSKPTEMVAGAPTRPAATPVASPLPSTDAPNGTALPASDVTLAAGAASLPAASAAVSPSPAGSLSVAPHVEPAVTVAATSSPGDVSAAPVSLATLGPPAITPPSPHQTGATTPPSAMTASAATTPAVTAAAEKAPAATAPAVTASAVTPPLALTQPASQAPATKPPSPSSQSPQAFPVMVLQATSDTWVQVRQSSVHVLLTRIMKAGDTWPVPAEPGLTLDTGNAGGLILEINGVPTRLASANGGVVHHVPLDADLLASGAVVRVKH